MSAQPQLIVPSRFAKGKPNRRKVSVRNRFAELIRGRKSAKHRRYHGPIWTFDGNDRLPEAPERPMGKPHGTHVLDLVEHRRVVTLCWACQPRFGHTHCQYHKDRRFPYVTARCDACRTFAVQAALYIPEELLADPRGSLRAGQSWTPA